ncbi:hypothetical protein SNK03_012803 [Fusarium graminearum]|uniref:Chromosome 3, complete genome n=2 Tax=Gibberella zeae TaxID=5518 RepID=I1S2G4_GIBZE|nr:hypothetical protein FGSG_10958 [Fusarium graminearum PH-1]EYB28947.1 hypothetical protein FG05_10958 [Fusarium graminearum]ESU17792.1 hypothetical protein FGSG_10958 [Fusarium graminearum PH-1]KAI6768635.1 hypothetical protein HG531_010824 [Fusarium graminearum]PCD36744.1 hypothetical protein FGRA07_07748 [Fusarium graminearum]CAF3484494.1 unnamed protein product [Fusarium graminearum]|eukprot:XP_011325414.1 hypothetical protein FGSG_10958 [Fusarium graminearum PH-1]
MPQIEDKPAFLYESWGLFALGLIILLARFTVRLRTVGWRGLQGDDAFSFLVLLFYTTDAVTVHLIYYLGTNIEAGVASRDHKELTDSEIREYELGSKFQLVAWYSYTALIWSLKGTMLCFFARMTIGTWHKPFVQVVSILCGITYAAVVLTISIGCLPYNANWQVVPDPPARCSFKIQNFLVTTVLNVITDGLILCIPLPLLWKLQIPCHKKFIIGLLLSSGVFVMAAALVRVVLTLSANPSALTINAWGIRETIVGIATVNIPVLRSLFSRSFWKGKTPSEICPSYQESSGSVRNRLTKQNISTPYGARKLFDGSGGWKHSHEKSEESLNPKNNKLADIIVERSYHVQHERYDGWQGHRHARSNTSIYAQSPV